MALWKKCACFPALPDFRRLDCSVCSSPVYHVTDVRFICLLMSFFLATPSWSAYGLRGRAEGSSLFFYGEPFLVHSHCCLTEVGQNEHWSWWESDGCSQRCLCDGSTTQSWRRVPGHPGLLHAWTVHTAVSFFQELPRRLWDSLAPVVHLQFTKLVYVKNQWKCLRRRLFGCVFFVGF